MDYDKFRFLLPSERVQAYAEEIENIESTLSLFGLGLDNSCIACDYILSLPVQEYPSYERDNYKGVYRRKNGRYYSKITKDRQYIFLGNFKHPMDAALAYDVKCYELYRNKNKLNFPELIKES